MDGVGISVIPVAVDYLDVGFCKVSAGRAVSYIGIELFAGESFQVDRDHLEDQGIAENQATLVGSRNLVNIPFMS